MGSEQALSGLAILDSRTEDGQSLLADGRMIIPQPEAAITQSPGELAICLVLSSSFLFFSFACSAMGVSLLDTLRH